MAKKVLNFKPQTLPSSEQAYSMLLGDKSENQIVNLPIDHLEEMTQQHFKIREERVESIARSMKEEGQLNPILVIPNPDKEGYYIIFAGRHRTRAAKLNGDTTIKGVIKRDLNLKEAELSLYTDNLERNSDYLPSELAFAYARQLELLKELGRTKTASAVAEANGTNRKSVHKYIQLTKLDKTLLNRVDKKEITVGAGYELSKLPPEKQKKIGLELFNHPDIHIDNKLARQLRENPNNVKDVLLPNKGQGYENFQTQESNTNRKKENKPKTELNTKCSPYYQMVIASSLYKSYETIFKHIVCDFYTPNEIIDFIKQYYRHSSIAGLPISSNNKKFKGAKFGCDFRNDLNIHIRLENETLLKFNLNLREVDTICRYYLRSLSRKQILKDLMGAE